MTVLTHLFVLVAQLSLFSCQKKTSVTIYSLTIFSEHEGYNILGAQQLYLQQFSNSNTSNKFSSNNNSDNYEFNILPLDTNGDSVTTINLALDIAQNINNEECSKNQLIKFENSSYREVVLPLILGAPLSSLNAITVPLLSGFNFGQISSTSTSVLLSDSESYPYFYRTIPSDNGQAEAIINLCKLFNWDKIGIMYVNDFYGVYLNVGIMDLALENNIETYSMSFQLYDNTSYQHAARQIEQLDLFIVVLILHTVPLSDIIKYGLEEEGVFGYPYYYILSEVVEDLPRGYMGTAPWVADAITVSDFGNYINNYDNDGYAESFATANEINRLWNMTYELNPDIVFNMTSPDAFSYYAWDSINALMNSLVIYDLHFGIETIWNGSYNQSFVMKSLNDILINNVHFFGATGNVSFDSNGDRENGDYLFRNSINDNNSVNFYPIHSNSTQYKKYGIDIFNDVVWPQEFENLGIIPQSNIIVDVKLKDLTSTVTSTMYVFVFCNLKTTYTSGV